jgi:two-component system, LytTR family, response regulator
MNKIKVVIIDDEASNRRIIAKLIGTLNPNYEILGEADSVAEGYDLIHKMLPQVVFLDIKMPDGSGFDLLKKFETINFEVVFITGFDSYAVKAFEFNALDYVLKPIDPIRFNKMLEKLSLKIRAKSSNGQELKNVLKTYNLHQLTISKISVHNGNAVVILNMEDIMYARSEEKCTFFKMKNGEKYSSAKELSDFSFILENHPYILRINKSAYINLNFIAAYSKGTTCFVTMKDETIIEISRRKKTEILELLKAGGTKYT